MEGVKFIYIYFSWGTHGYLQQTEVHSLYVISNQDKFYITF